MATSESETTGKTKMTREKRGVPGGLWLRCDDCGETIFRKEAEGLMSVCPQCGYHMYLSAPDRVRWVLDEGTFEEWDASLSPTDPLSFRDKKAYAERIFFFIEPATTENLPLIIISGSGGGARMHEGILSLMQMAKVSAALARYDQAGGLFISVLTNPTMGGVAASFASLGDIIFAEPKALIGFAGPRTIQATIRIELPKGFQTSEFLLEHGYVDRIVRRSDLKSEIARAIDYCGKMSRDAKSAR